MDRLIALQDVGDFRAGDVMPYTDPIDINILTTLGVARLERPAPEPEEGEEEEEVEELVVLGTQHDHDVTFSEELAMENPNPVDVPSDPVPAPVEEPLNAPYQDPDPSPGISVKHWEDDGLRHGLRAEQGSQPKDPEEYRTRVMNEDRLHNKKRRRTRTRK